MCGDCFNVSGPANATVDFFSYAAQANSTYQVAASWEASYRGPITIGLEAQRRGACKAPWSSCIMQLAWGCPCAMACHHACNPACSKQASLLILLCPCSDMCRHAALLSPFVVISVFTFAGISGCAGPAFAVQETSGC